VDAQALAAHATAEGMPILFTGDQMERGGVAMRGMCRSCRHHSLGGDYHFSCFHEGNRVAHNNDSEDYPGKGPMDSCHLWELRELHDDERLLVEIHRGSKDEDVKAMIERRFLEMAIPMEGIGRRG